MKYIDTNVLVHLITNSPKHTVDTIEKVLAQAAPSDVIITEGVLVETCTILEFNTRFGLDRPLICTSLEAIFTRQAISLSAELLTAFNLYRTNPKLDIVDCLLAVYGNSRAENVLTFDKDLQKVLN